MILLLIASLFGGCLGSVPGGWHEGEIDGNPENRIGPCLKEIIRVADGGAKPCAELEKMLDAADICPNEETDLFCIVTFDDEAADAGRRRLGESGFLHQHFNVLPMSGVIAKIPEIRDISTWPEVRNVYWNAPLQFFLNESAETAGVRQVWETYGEYGKNATVMFIDSGIDGSHPDILFGRNLIQSVLPVDVENNSLPIESVENVPVTDLIGHGTHCMGITGGSGQAAGGYDPTETVGDPLWHHKYRGMAPECKLISFGLIVSDGVVPFMYCALLGFDYALEKQDEYDIRIISNSWGGFRQAFDPEDPVQIAMRECYENGMMVSVAAGNGGPGAGSMNPYSVAPWVISVGAGTKDNHLADFSSRGTNIPYDHPDIVAPGVAIMSTKSRVGALQALSAGQGPYPPPVQGTLDATLYYQYMSGTSMSCPHATGIAALLFSANPDLSPDQVMDILTETTDPVLDMENEIWHMVAGYVNATAAYLLALNTTGNMNEFLNGTYKYASGGTDLDPEYAIDCVSVGYDYWPIEEKEVAEAQEVDVKETPGFGAAAVMGTLALTALTFFVLRKRKER